MADEKIISYKGVDYMRAASEYLIANKFTKANNVDSVLNRLSVCAKTGKKYKNRFCVEFC